MSSTASNAINTNGIDAITPTTGAISIGASQTDGILNLGTGSRTTTGVINIATATSDACAVNIKNGATSAGLVNIANGTGITQTTAVNIANNSTTGAVTIGNSANSTNMNSQFINLSNQTGNVNIKTGDNDTGQVNIGTGTSVSTNNVVISIGSGNTIGTTTIGNSGNITTLSSATINVNGALTMGTGKNIKLQPTAGYIAPTADTMLGGIREGSFSIITFPLTTSTNLASINLVKATYIIFFAVQIDTVSPSQCWVNFEGGTALPALNPAGSGSYRFGNTTLITGSNLGISGSFPYSCSTAGSVIIKLQLSGSISGIPIKIFQAMRIA